MDNKPFFGFLQYLYAITRSDSRAEDRLSDLCQVPATGQQRVSSNPIQTLNDGSHKSISVQLGCCVYLYIILINSNLSQTESGFAAAAVLAAYPNLRVVDWSFYR